MVHQLDLLLEFLISRHKKSKSTYDSKTKHLNCLFDIRAGALDGWLDGKSVGVCDGDIEGISVGTFVGFGCGDTVGENVGTIDGPIDGASLGAFDGDNDGDTVGLSIIIIYI